MENTGTQGTGYENFMKLIVSSYLSFCLLTPVRVLTCLHVSLICLAFCNGFVHLCLLGHVCLSLMCLSVYRFLSGRVSLCHVIVLSVCLSACVCLLSVCVSVYTVSVSCRHLAYRSVCLHVSLIFCVCLLSICLTLAICLSIFVCLVLSVYVCCLVLLFYLFV